MEWLISRGIPPKVYNSSNDRKVLHHTVLYKHREKGLAQWDISSQSCIELKSNNGRIIT